jgi:hypothetical protein
MIFSSNLDRPIARSMVPTGWGVDGPDSSLWAMAEWWVGPVCHASKIKVHDKHFVCRAL